MASSGRPRFIVAVDGAIHRERPDHFVGAAASIVLRTHVPLHEGSPVRLNRLEINARYFTDKVTNNRMELQAFLLGMESATNRRPAVVSTRLELWSDSQYALGILFRKNWHPRDNLDLVNQGRSMIANYRNAGFSIYGNFIRGHSGYFINELADLAAQRCIKRHQDIEYELEAGPWSTGCLFCEYFPCESGQKLPTWKKRFDALRRWGFPDACEKVVRYEPEFTLAAC